MAKKNKYSKYSNCKVIVDSLKFDSKKEARRYQELKILEKANLIRELELQKRFTLQDKYQNGKGKKIRKIEYVCDFYYFDIKQGKYIVEDVKGYKTTVYKLKKKIFEAMYKPLTITEI